MLFKLLWKGECWHEEKEWKTEYSEEIGANATDRSYPTLCVKCKDPHIFTDIQGNWYDAMGQYVGNPNLFNSWEGFGKVWEVAKDREDWQDDFCEGEVWNLIDIIIIDSPSFQLDVLRWRLEQEGRGGELKEKMREVGE